MAAAVPLKKMYLIGENKQRIAFVQKEVFMHGFRLGARIVIEALYREQDEDRR